MLSRLNLLGLTVGEHQQFPDCFLTSVLAVADIKLQSALGGN